MVGWEGGGGRGTFSRSNWDVGFRAARVCLRCDGDGVAISIRVVLLSLGCWQEVR